MSGRKLYKATFSSTIYFASSSDLTHIRKVAYNLFEQDLTLLSEAERMVRIDCEEIINKNQVINKNWLYGVYYGENPGSESVLDFLNKKVTAEKEEYELYLKLKEKFEKKQAK